MADDVISSFDAGAGRYDLLVALNPGYHRHLADAASVLAERSPGLASALDLGCGSGASTRALERALPDAQVTGVDASSGMLAEARRKRWPARISFVQGRAGDLARDGLRAAGALAAYLFRNVPAPERTAALADARSVLEPGGWLVVQEYSVAGSRRARVVWSLVCWLVVMPLSLLTRGNPRLYYYLWRSVLDNDSTASFMARMADAGFVDVACRSVPGWQHGILHTFVGRRPEPARDAE